MAPGHGGRMDRKQTMREWEPQRGIYTETAGHYSTAAWAQGE